MNSKLDELMTFSVTHLGRNEKSKSISIYFWEGSKPNSVINGDAVKNLDSSAP